GCPREGGPPGSRSLGAVDDPPAREVVRAQLDLHLVPREDSDEVLPHLPRDVREHAVTPFDLHGEHRVGEGLNHPPLDFNGVVLRHSLTSSLSRGTLRWAPRSAALDWRELLPTGPARVATPCRDPLRQAAPIRKGRPPTR